MRIARRFLPWMPGLAIIVIAACILLAAVLFAVTWIMKKESGEDVSVALSFWQGITRYMIATDLILFGLQKFFGLQFSMPLAMLDLPFSSFSGEDLTFAYFARSFAFVVIIGSLQIMGSLLLLFSRTRLAGIFVLLPIMINIVLLNICYNMEVGELLHSSILLVALFALLSSDYNRLKAFFFEKKNKQSFSTFKKTWLKNTVRFSAMGIPLLLIWSYRMPEKHPAVYGKYAVSKLSIDHQLMQAASCKDSVLTLVYLDQNADCIFEYNSQQKRLIGNYLLDEATHKLRVDWRYPATVKDTLFASLSPVTPGKPLLLSGKMGNHLLEMELVKINQP